MSKDIPVPVKQRALVLQGGGALGAYEAGVLKVLYKHLSKEDKKKGKNKGLLFDVIAGSSIGAMNGTVLVSQFLMTGNWMDAIKSLVKFWKDKELGLASSTPEIKIEEKDWLNDNWYQEYLNSASKETARRYYSARHFAINGAPKFFSPLTPRHDFKFFDDLSKWQLIYSNKPLEKTIRNFANFPVKTNFENNEPRLLVFAVDVEEGEMVTFDSYSKEDGSRKSEYGRYEKFSGFKHRIKYPGITIEHVMASGTLPLVYDYAKVPIDQTIEQEESEYTKDIMAKEDNEHEHNKIRYFWDSGLLNNTPFRELLQAHQNYWGKNKESKIPDLEVYIVNLHPKKIDRLTTPKDFDGVKDRHNDLTYGDRSSHYDEKIIHLITDYRNFVIHINNLIKKFISNNSDVNNIGLQKIKEKLQLEYKNILSTNTISKDYINGNEQIPIKYEDLISYGFNLNKVIRIERTNYVNSISAKGADTTYETINKLIIEGECDAWISIIHNEITDIKLHSSIDNSTKNNMIESLDKIICHLNHIIYNLKDNDFENIKEVDNEISKIINNINKSKKIDEINPDQFNKILDYLEDFKETLQNIED